MLQIRKSAGALILAASLPAFPQSSESVASLKDHEVATGLLRCETFYKQYYESLRYTKPGALSIPSLAKLPAVIRFLRIAAESLIGEQEARKIYGQNIEAQIMEFTAAATGSDWSGYANRMNAECKKLSDENDNEQFTLRLNAYMKARGIENPLQPN